MRKTNFTPPTPVCPKAERCNHFKNGKCYRGNYPQWDYLCFDRKNKKRKPRKKKEVSEDVH